MSLYIPAILAAVIILDHVLAAIPESTFAPGSTWQLVVHLARALAEAVADALRRPPGPPAVALLVALLLPACATAPGHYVTTPPDPQACAAAGVAAVKAQLPCDKSPRPPLQEILACSLAAFLELRPCMPVSVWVADPPVK